MLNGSKKWYFNAIALWWRCCFSCAPCGFSAIKVTPPDGVIAFHYSFQAKPIASCPNAFVGRNYYSNAQLKPDFQCMLNSYKQSKKYLYHCLCFRCFLSDFICVHLWLNNIKTPFYHLESNRNYSAQWQHITKKIGGATSVAQLLQQCAAKAALPVNAEQLLSGIHCPG